MHRPRRVGSATDWAASHPEWWSLLLSAAAWVAMLFHSSVPGAQALCLAAPNGQAGPFGGLAAAWESGALGRLWSEWTVMTMAMLPPLAIPLTRHVAARSFPARRYRATIGFLSGAFFAWLLLGLAVVPLLQLLADSWHGRPEPVGAGFLAAALWQFTPQKRRALSGCHRTVPLGAAGWQADRDCTRYGFDYGRACAGSCWALMLASALAAHSLKSSLCVQAIAVAERRTRQPRPWTSVIVLAACATVELAPLLVAAQL